MEIILTYLQELVKTNSVRKRSAATAEVICRPNGATLKKDFVEGKIYGVVSTNALELGVDIGQLQVCVMTGYPGSIASTWQQAGRAGRRHGESLVIIVASSNPLDQYIIQHPDYFFAAARKRPASIPTI